MSNSGRTNPIQNSALNQTGEISGLFSMLFKQKQGYEAASQAAQKGMKDLSGATHNSAWKLYAELVKQGQGWLFTLDDE